MLIQDGNEQVIEALGPRNQPAGMPDCAVSLTNAANRVTLETNKVYRVIGEVRFHFRLGGVAIVVTANDEMQPADLPMFITTDANHSYLSLIAPYGNGQAWIGEWS